MVRRIYEIRQFTSVLDRLWTNILIVGFLQVTIPVQSHSVDRLWQRCVPSPGAQGGQTVCVKPLRPPLHPARRIALPARRNLQDIVTGASDDRVLQPVGASVERRPIQSRAKLRREFLHSTRRPVCYECRMSFTTAAWTRNRLYAPTSLRTDSNLLINIMKDYL